MSQVPLAEAQALLDAVKTSMDGAVERMKPTLDKIEEEVLKNYRMFGASDYDVEQTRKWLRREMDKQARAFIVEKFKEMIDKKKK